MVDGAGINGINMSKWIEIESPTKSQDNNPMKPPIQYYSNNKRLFQLKNVMRNR